MYYDLVEKLMIEEARKATIPKYLYHGAGGEYGRKILRYGFGLRGSEFYGISLSSDRNSAKQFLYQNRYKQEKTYLFRVKLDSNIKVLSAADAKERFTKFLDSKGQLIPQSGIQYYEDISDYIAREAKKEGFDAIDFRTTPTVEDFCEVRVVNPKVIRVVDYKEFESGVHPYYLGYS